MNSEYMDHDRWVRIGTDSPLDYTPRLPAEIEDALCAKELEIDKALKDFPPEEVQLKESLGEAGSEQRRLYEEQFLTQLRAHSQHNETSHKPYSKKSQVKSRFRNKKLRYIV